MAKTADASVFHFMRRGQESASFGKFASIGSVQTETSSARNCSSAAKISGGMREQQRGGGEGAASCGISPELNDSKAERSECGIAFRANPRTLSVCSLNVVPMTETSHSRSFVDAVRERVAQVVVGQDIVVERLLIALFTGGHLLLQGMPGLAKTLLVNCVARAIDVQFSRVQFTIDLLPSDIVGSEILDQKKGEFRTQKGPIFTNLLLADEINRGAPKLQSALLEAM